MTNATRLSIACFLSAPACAGALAQPAPSVLWSRQHGSWAGSEYGHAVGESAGALYIAGATAGQYGGAPLGPEEWTDALLMRLDAAGEPVWVRRFGTYQHDGIWCLVPDTLGGVLVVGTTLGDFAGQTGLIDGFVARFDSAGAEIWRRQFGSTSNDNVYSAAPDGQGGVYICGDTSGSLASPSAGNKDIYLLRYDGQGSLLWARQFGTDAYDYGLAVASDGAGAVYITGASYGSLGGPAIGGGDAWLARYDAAGSRVWIRQFGTTTADGAEALAADGAGGVYVAGGTYGVLGSSGFGNADAFIARYNGGGDQLWVRQFGTDTPDGLVALAHDGAGGVYGLGETSGSIGGPYAGESNDGFLCRFDASGNRTWIVQVGTANNDKPRAIISDPFGTPTLIGFVDVLGAPFNSPDIFVARYAPPCYANCDRSTTAPLLSVADFTCFLQRFAAGLPYANCDNSTIPPVLNVADFTCFLQRYAAGCN